jgi:hypothetical protein
LQTCGHELEYNQFSIDIDTLNKLIAQPLLEQYFLDIISYYLSVEVLLASSFIQAEQNALFFMAITNSPRL